jgi:hypothetical protein
MGTAEAGLIAAYDNTGATYGVASGQLNIGREFQVTGNGISVFDLGVYNFNSAGLQSSHTVTLFSLDHLGSGATATPISGGSVTVPGGTGGTLIGGFRYAALDAPIYLPAGDYAVIAYALNATHPATGTDPYGDHGGLPSAGNNVTPFQFDPYQFVNASSPAYPTAGDTNNHSSASFLFQVGPLSVPEPSSLALLALGGGALAGWRRWRKRKATA